MLNKASFTLKFLFGIMLIALFLIAYQPGYGSLSYKLTGLVVEEYVQEDTGFLEMFIILTITLYFASIVFFEIVKVKKSRNKKTVKEILEKNKQKPFE